MRIARVPLVLAFIATSIGGPARAQTTAPARAAAAPATAAKKPLDHDAYDRWNRITAPLLSEDGRWAAYVLARNTDRRDGELRIRGVPSDGEHAVPRGDGARFSADSRYIVFRIRPEREAVRQARLERKRADQQPKDSLGILDLSSGEVVKVARVKSFALPQAVAGWVAYHLEKPLPEADEDEPAEGAAAEAQPAAAGARAGARRGGGGGEGARGRAERERERDEGTELVVRRLGTEEEERIAGVVSYEWSREGGLLAYAVWTEDGSGDGVHVLEPESGRTTALLGGKGNYKRLAVDEAGQRVAFLTDRAAFAAEAVADSAAADAGAEEAGPAAAAATAEAAAARDTTEVPGYELYHWRRGMGEAERIAAEGVEGVAPGWRVSEHGAVSFSRSGGRLFFGTAPRPEPEPENGDEVLDEERVRVDIWNWRDPLIQPMQLRQAEQERRRSYRAVALLEDGGRIVQLATAAVPDVTVGDRGDAAVAVGTSNLPYRQLISWDGRYADVYLVDVRTGERQKILEQKQGGASLSPAGRYLYWYDNRERAWFAMDVAGERRVVNLTERLPYPIHNELHDAPSEPRPYGSAGWTEGDALFLVYDRHDVWALDPTGRARPRVVTDGMGRAEGLRLRYVRLDPEEPAIDAGGPLLLSAFDLRTKADGFYRDRVEGGRRPERLIMADASFSTPRKAKDADVLLYTRSTFEEFGDLWTADLAFRDARRLSDANPQQQEYLWGTAELVEWRSADGVPLQGILHKPEGFDPSRKYPMLVYFYERLSDGLHNHIIPSAGSSSINVSVYVSRGYLVFRPDIPYKAGYPGESALNAIVPGVLSLIDRGFVDEDAIGLQGHSWGGYQTLYLVTRTHMFAAAEAGAPVANMTSAYGGIRWGSGMVRQFQYEKTQSRIGASLWEAPMRFIENSPLFWADKVETPVLMLHNDQDDAVPWYQGIEFYAALRRLGKPVWMLNYNGEPHGLRREQNRKDWAIRMQQFFDHYLQGAPPPVWLAEGVPAVLKGRTLGLELIEEPVRAGAANGGSR